MCWLLWIPIACLLPVTQGHIKKSLSFSVSGFMSVPLVIPGLGVWKGIRARKFLIKSLTGVVGLHTVLAFPFFTVPLFLLSGRARLRMSKADQKPECLL